MELRQLLHFLALAEERSFRGAAERVHLTQQAVSKSIAQLEARLGVQLFERDGKSVSLTAFGELLRPHAQAVTAELRQFEDALDARLGVRAGRLRIGATPSTLGDIVPAALSQVQAAHPQLVVSVHSADWDSLARRLLRGEIDLVLSTEPTDPVDELIVAERLCPARIVVLAARHHPLAAGAAPAPARLLDHPWVEIVNLPRAEQDLREYFATAGLEPPGARTRAESAQFAISWVERTDALCAMSDRAAARDIAAGRVVVLGVQLSSRPWHLIAARRRRAAQSPAALAFMAAVRAVVVPDGELLAEADPRGR
jgi:DNA-binding transcriptional LysR family regulator